MGVASVFALVVGYVLSHVKRYELMEERRPICVQHHKFPVLIKKGALQWNPQVCCFLEEKLKTIFLLFEWTLCDLFPFPPWFFFLVSCTVNPRLDNEATSYHHCSWQTAAFHPVRLINKHMTHKRFTQRWIWHLRPCHALNSSGVLGSGRTKKKILSFSVGNIYFETSSSTAAQLVFNKAVLIIYRCIHHKSFWHSNSEFLEQVKVAVTPVNPTWQHSNK